MSNVPKLRFKEFSGNYINTKIGSVVKASQGLQIAISNRFNEPSDDRVHYITIPYTQGNKVEYIENPKKSVICTKNDILVVRTGSGVGKILRGFEGAFHNNFFKLVTKDTLNDDYLYYFLHKPKTKFLMNTYAGTSAIPDLNHGDFYSIDIAFPNNINEQEKIASFLTSVDTKIEQLTQKEEFLKQYKKGVMQQIFSQEVRFKADDGSEYAPWEEKKLGNVFSGIKGQGLSKGDIVSDGINKCILYGELYTTYPEVIKKVVSKTNSSSGVKSRKGDLLVPCSTTTTGIDLADVTALNEDDVLLGGDITILRFKKEGNPIFFAYYLTHYKKHNLAKYGQGSTIVHMYYNHFKNMKIEYPASIEEQEKIANFLSSIDSKIEQVTKQIESTKEFKKALLQQMFV